MKNYVLKFVLSFVFLVFLLGISAKDISAQNSINGIVFDNNRKPVSEINVELLDGFERLIKTTKTKGSGLYFFQSLPAGVYYVQIRVGGTGFKEVKERIQLGESNRTVQTSSGNRTSGSESRQLNFVLEIDENRRNRTPINNTVVFAQNVPEEAENYYNNALKNLEKENREEAVQDLNQAIKIFPEYFAALENLGNIYLDQNKYAEAENVFEKAINVNAKSFRSYFGLAVAQNNLKKKVKAAENLKKANVIDATSINAHLFLGIVQRELKQFDEAEKSLLKAKDLSDNKVPDVHWNLGLLYYYNFKRYAAAADELELYLKAIPKNDLKQMGNKIEDTKRIIKILRKKAEAESQKNSFS